MARSLLPKASPCHRRPVDEGTNQTAAKAGEIFSEQVSERRQDRHRALTGFEGAFESGLMVDPVHNG